MSESSDAAKPPKENFSSIYVEETPQSYVKTLIPVDYGHYHDRYHELVQAELEEFAPKDRQMIAVELGASYGNTTLSYKCGHNWDAAVDFWLNEEKPMEKKWDFHVVAVDISPQALGFGQRRNIFDTSIVHDFTNPPTHELATTLEKADFLTAIMTTFYIPTDRWHEMLFKFIADRSKPKLLVYNVMMAFDKRNLTPEQLFGHGWTSKRSFNKHRNFTALEQTGQHGCKEAWTMTYLVRFDVIVAKNSGH
ncbi:hypothetical protein T484DRAFT_1813521 [Baffinella frigidus]|nr:hypothetical protein T484DRAFT_1813521 [Cryptophyta sp. CCMP2293]